MSLGTLWRRTFSSPQYKDQRFRRCIIHIGAEKTGTSAIQQFLVQNREKFAAEGVLYSKSTGGDGGSQWAFPALSLPESWKSDIGLFLNARNKADMTALLTKFQRSFEAEIAQLKVHDTLVISSEHLHSRLTSAEHMENLKEYVSGFADNIEVILYIRRQDRMAVSLYSTKIKSGNPRPILFPDIPASGLPYYFNFEKIYEEWSSVFGTDAVQVRVYEPSEFYKGDLIRDFCRATDLKIAGKLATEDRVNASLSIKAAHFLNAVNQRLPNIIDGERNAERDFLAHEVSRLFPGQFHPAIKNDARAFLANFQESNDRLKARLFPDRAQPLFDEDFSDYLETFDAPEPVYDEAVEVAIEIWKAAEARRKSLEANNAAPVAEVEPQPEPSAPATYSAEAEKREVAPAVGAEAEPPKTAVPTRAEPPMPVTKPTEAKSSAPVPVARRQLVRAKPDVDLPVIPKLADRPVNYENPLDPILVSIVMPSFNQAKFIARSIESVLGQSYANLELIIMDGGSTDGTVDILKSYAEKDSRVRWTSETDNGPASAVNKALKSTRGTVIGWLNSDDLFAANAVQKACDAFAENLELIMYYGEGIYVDQDDRAISVYSTRAPSVGIGAFVDGCFLCQPTVFFSKSLHRLLGPLDESLKTSFDFDYWLRAFRSFPGRIGRTTDVQALSRLHDDCITAKQRELVAIEGIKLIKKYLGKSALPWFYTYVDECVEASGNAELSAKQFNQLGLTLSKLEADLSAEDVQLARKMLEGLKAKSTA